MTITVANKRSGAKGEYVGRPSPLGNPFVVGRDGTREEVIAKYAEWLEYRVRGGRTACADELHRLTEQAQQGDITLVCWCAPLPCHADVIKAKIEAAIGGDQ